MSMNGRVVTVFGGSGFIGSVLVGSLAAQGARVRVALRDMEKGAALRPLGELGQVSPLLCSFNDPVSVGRLVEGADSVVNLTGILSESGPSTFESVHVQMTGLIAREAKRAGVRSLVHMSALGADGRSPSLYARTKSLGEAAVRTAYPKATIIRPSVVFGMGDSFLNRFATMTRDIPVLFYIDRGPAGGVPKFQPVWVGDVSEAIVRILCDPALQGRTFELGGAKVFSMKEIMERLVAEMRQPIRLIGLPIGLARVIATLVGWLPKPILTRDQVRLLETDNVLDGKLPGLKELGIYPQSLETVLAEMMIGYRPMASGVVLRGER